MANLPVVAHNVNVAVQQVMSLGVQAMTLNIFAQALGIMASGAALKVPLTEQTPSQAAVKELSHVYGVELTTKVLNENPGKDIATIAAAIDAEATSMMRQKYGDKVTEMALACALATFASPCMICSVLRSQSPQHHASSSANEYQPSVTLLK